MILDRARGAAFDDADVARSYVHRAPYAPALYERLFELPPGRDRALDLGCGPGKIARVLADHFSQVDAVDPSRTLLQAGQAADAGRHPNIHWIEASAETADLAGPFDLIAAGSSLHWMDHAVVFPKLARELRPDGLVAAISGDGASQTRWDADFRAFLADWLGRMGMRYDESGFGAAMTAYVAWMDIQGRETFSYGHTQPVEDFIASQHARETWTRARMGPELARAFDQDLRRLVQPHTRDGMLRFTVTSHLVWGRPRIEPHPA